ncbi:hypothetical protein CH366_10485 [Leptospira harrisiae]|uniref:Uncharacterized protein n=1 Tax=Leptospira harrisiae TaxID=2023189 RepID=A0A2N0AHB7_9LEPT|nr:hypothetical protein CH364_15775 [Leptospira harrisiae]PKA06888.1 hypothetical protein CH366_10485 [Leptospira harrisiae]
MSYPNLLIYVFFYILSVFSFLLFDEKQVHNPAPEITILFTSLLHPIYIISLFSNIKFYYLWIPSLGFWISIFSFHVIKKVNK